MAGEQWPLEIKYKSTSHHRVKQLNAIHIATISITDIENTVGLYFVFNHAAAHCCCSPALCRPV